MKIKKSNPTPFTAKSYTTNIFFLIGNISRNIKQILRINLNISFFIVFKCNNYFCFKIYVIIYPNYITMNLKNFKTEIIAEIAQSHKRLYKISKKND